MTGAVVTNYPTSVAGANAALGFGVFDHGWLFDETAGDMLPAFGGVTLAASGSGLVYGDAGPIGGTDRAIGFTAGGSGKFSGGSNFDVAGTDDLVLAWVGQWRALPTAFGQIAGKASASFANGWALTGKDGTGMSFAAGATGSVTSTVAGASAYHVGVVHVGVAAIERAAGRLRFGTRSVAGTTVLGPQSGSFGSTSFSTASSFTIWSGDWVAGNENFRMASLFVGKSPGAAGGLVANLDAALLNFHAYVTRSDNYKAKVMRRQLPPPYKKDFGAVVPAILTVIGQSDNLIGGLFGTDDFLPDEG